MSRTRLATVLSTLVTLALLPAIARADEDETAPSLPPPSLPPPTPAPPAPPPAEPTPPGESEAAAVPAPAPVPTPPRKLHVAPTVEIGGVARRLFALNLTGFEGALGIDVHREASAMAGIARVSYGRTTSQYGLPVHVLRLEGGLAAVVAERFRLGGTAGLGGIDVERATSGQLTKIGFALGGLASADLIQSESFAVYVALDGTLDFYPHLQRDWTIGGVLASAALRLGARF